MLIDAIEAASVAVPDPSRVSRLSPDPDDDYLIALAQREGVEAIVTGDPDLSVEGGPPTFTPRELLEQLQMGSDDQVLLATALWNLHLRLQSAAEENAVVEHFLPHVHSAVRKLGGDPDEPVFGLEEVGQQSLDVRTFNRSERTACAYALEVNREATGQLHAQHVRAMYFSGAFEILDRHAAIEDFIGG